MLNITENEQNIIKSIPIVFIGCNMSSIIAESILRFGFESILLIDDSLVEKKNLSTSAFTENSIKKFASEVLYHKLKEINPESNLSYFTSFENLEEIVGFNKIIIHTLDLNSKIQETVRRLSDKNDVLYPFNLGLHSLVTIVRSNGIKLDFLNSLGEISEVRFLDYVSSFLKFWNTQNSWIIDVSNAMQQNFDNKMKIQNTVSSYVLAGMCTDLIFRIVTKRDVKWFPKFYIDYVSS